ncbi:MAG: universal stress protein [Gemmatimonadaceae bacterium]
MYKRILVPLEHTAFDQAILDHVRQLARLCGSSLVVIHVADGWVARNIQQLDLRESEEMRGDREYLEQVAEGLVKEGFRAEALLASGDPAREITDAAVREGCDLIAMSTHGHRFLGDLIHGSVADSVRHRCTIPVLLVRGHPAKDAAQKPADSTKQAR